MTGCLPSAGHCEDLHSPGNLPPELVAGVCAGTERERSAASSLRLLIKLVECLISPASVRGKKIFFHLSGDEILNGFLCHLMLCQVDVRFQGKSFVEQAVSVLPASSLSLNVRLGPASILTEQSGPVGLKPFK